MLVIVETVEVTCSLVTLPDVIVLVTGQVVSYVVTSTVVYTATVVLGTIGEEEAPVGEFSVVDCSDFEGVLNVSVAGVDALPTGIEGVGELTTGVVEELKGTE